MFEYCRGRHVDPSYLYSGTVDYGILDPETGVLLMYSVVNMGGQWLQFVIHPPFQFEEIAKRVTPKAKNLQDIFRSGASRYGMKIKLECLRVEKENLMPIALKDAAALSPEDQALLESAIGEVF